MRRIVPFLLVLFALVSCATMKDAEDPSWLRESPSVIGSAVFVGEGHGPDLSSARAECYRDILEKMSRDLGYDVVSLFYREMVNTDRISEFGTVIRDSFTRSENGSYSYYALSVTPEQRFYRNRTAEYREILAREDQIEDRLSQAMDYYKENRDTKAIESILSALDASLSGKVVNEDYSPSSLLGRALEYIGSLELSTSKESQKSVDVMVYVKRTKGPFHPGVKDAIVKAEYAAVTLTGEDSDDYLLSSTGDDGSFRFRKTNPFMFRDGTVRFSFSFDSALIKSIEEKAGKDFLEPLYSMIDQKSIGYDYHDDGAFDTSSAVLGIAVYDMKGNQIDSSQSRDVFCGYLEKLGIDSSFVVAGDGDEEEEILQDLLSSYPDKRCIIVVRLGIVDSKPGYLDQYVRAEGRLAAIDAFTGDTVFYDNSFAVGKGSTTEDAEREAIIEETKVIAGLLLSKL